MRSLFVMGFQPMRRPALGQVMSQPDRDHYLFALSRAVNEADEIDKWLANNAGVKLSVPVTTPPSDLQMSPYFTKWVKFKEVRPDMQKLMERLAGPDPTTWSSLTSDEHITFGWVSVVDQIFSAFKADPKNLTIGKWEGDTRLPDPPVPGAPASSPTILGMPKTVVLIGGAVIGLGILAVILD
jgi:hypothetical protein